ncbi:uncharacterized protein LOC123989243 [Osmia bicornis bicornis]|uniref:uncharacterized protein LOC123989243 n=1 Tax=Osmia bicornis bicornis TaxID=1437191 RepID=UPI001EAEF2A7|nr:uncharacterized protein LOC123989243 [Osmia bicornis bicornis]
MDKNSMALFAENIGNQVRSIPKFIADSGTTEHITNSKIIFKTINKGDCGLIKCANKNNSADIRVNGTGKIAVRLRNGKILEIDKVIFTETLKENLLSLRKFAEMGLAIYLDNQRINIFDPSSKEMFLTGIYKRPFWIIELEVVGRVSRTSATHNITQANASLAEENPENKRYITRSVTSRENQQDKLNEMQGENKNPEEVLDLGEDTRELNLGKERGEYLTETAEN